MLYTPPSLNGETATALMQEMNKSVYCVKMFALCLTLRTLSAILRKERNQEAGDLLLLYRIISFRKVIKEPISWKGIYQP